VSDKQMSHRKRKISKKNFAWETERVGLEESICKTEKSVLAEEGAQRTEEGGAKVFRQRT